MRKIEKIELLSPVGSLAALKQAIHNGADAVYLGGTHFGARAFANNFNNIQLKEAVKYAHLYGTKIYITVNTLIYENEIQSFKEYIDFLSYIGVDALIMQDIGMANWAINTYNIPVHSSTQMHNYSLSNAQYLKDQGFERAVLARETHIDDIKKTSEIMETEVFAHGALCISYSGQCLFSAIEHDRSGNRGRCAQACRMEYSLYVDNKPIVKNKFLLSPKDLALLDDAPQLAKAGANSIKLEGRMKSPEYVGFITKIYRNIIDAYYKGNESKITSEDTNTLKHLFNRGFTKGYTFGHDNKELMSIVRPNHSGVHIGDVISTNKGYITIKLFKTLNQGDGVKFEKTDKGFVCNKIYHTGRLVNRGESGQTIQLDNKLNLIGNDRLLLTKDTKLNKQLNNYEEKRIPVNIRGEFRLDKPSTLIISDLDGNEIYARGAVVEQSRNAPLSMEGITENINKLGDSPYDSNSTTIDMDENIFLTKGNINKLRRDAVELLNSARSKTTEYKKKTYIFDYTAPLPHACGFSCTVINSDQLNAVLEYSPNKIYIRDFDLYKKNKNKHQNVYYFMDALNGNTEDYNDERLVIRDTGGIKYAQNNTVIADYMLNITNSQSLAHMNACKVFSCCLSVELDNKNIKSLCENYKNQYGCFPNAEVLVYGRIQLMATKHCILEGNIECGKCKTSDIYIEDIKGGKFPVLTDDKCNNYIYAKEPIDKLSNIPYIKSMGVNSFRLDFLNESSDEIVSILNKILGHNL